MVSKESRTWIEQKDYEFDIWLNLKPSRYKDLISNEGFFHQENFQYGQGASSHSDSIPKDVQRPGPQVSFLSCAIETRQLKNIGLKKR